MLDRLGKLLDTPRLLRMTATLQQTAAGLIRSPNRRIDTELCLVSLCDPRMDDSPAGLAARVTALEEMVAKGGVVERPPVHEDAPPETRSEVLPPVRSAPVQAAPPVRSEPPVRSAPPAPPAPAPPPVRSAPSAAVSWQALRAKLEKVMNIADFSFVGNEDTVKGTVEGRTVTLWALSEFIKGFIDKPDILKLVADTAGELAGGQPFRVQVRVGRPPAVSAPPAGRDPLDALMGLENVREL